MSSAGLDAAVAKMRRAGIAAEAITVFSHSYAQLEAGATGLVREADVRPFLDPGRLTDDDDGRRGRDALAQTAVIKLNGGLGTSMGMDRAKSLLPVRPARTFLDLIVQQVRQARAAYDVSLPLILMNSFRTRDDARAALATYSDLAVPDVPSDFLQNRQPKLTVGDLWPVSWAADPALEWCPPGHGDIYPALMSSGVLDALLAAGYRYAFTSNADNLGAAPSAAIAGWFARSGAAYAAEVCARTPADRKGGHLVVRRTDSRIVLRDTAQTAPEDLGSSLDEHRHPFVHTNNLWFDLHALKAVLQARGGVLGLPLICNRKTVDPRDPTSPEVFQMETAMGAAIEVFDTSVALLVERERFVPVKTTNDLLSLRSDVYSVTERGTLTLTTDAAPFVDLDPRYFRVIDDFDARFPEGAPSLREVTSLRVRGDWTILAGADLRGDVELDDAGSPQTLEGR
jgi:UTP--glucose-1-phosphate uridylyltransferase